MQVGKVNTQVGKLDEQVSKLAGRLIGKSLIGRVLTSAVYISAFLMAVLVFSGCATTTATSGASVNSSGGAVSSSGASANSGVRGVVTAPVDGAYIFVYEKGADPHGPPYQMSKVTGPDGSFEMGLPDGEYTIVARKHKNGQPGSPLTKDEDQKSAPVNITVKGGVISMQSLVMATKADDARYFGASASSETSISGKILDSEGGPMKGFRVHVYTYAQMSERPKYVSGATGADGRFIVYLPKGGTYYLAARDNFGAPPKIGDYYGRYDEGTIDPSGVILRTGQKLENINITVHKVW